MNQTATSLKDEHEYALAIAHRGYVLETGRVVMTGSGQELLGDARVREAYLGL